LFLKSQQTQNFFKPKLYFRCIVPMAAIRYSGPIQK